MTITNNYYTTKEVYYKIEIFWFSPPNFVGSKKTFTATWSIVPYITTLVGSFLLPILWLRAPIHPVFPIYHEHNCFKHKLPSLQTVNLVRISIHIT